MISILNRVIGLCREIVTGIRDTAPSKSFVLQFVKLRLAPLADERAAIERKVELVSVVEIQPA